MKPLNDPLDRLLKSAAAAPKPGTGAARFILEARVVGAWRVAPAENGEVVLAWMRRAVIAACVLALACLAWDYGQFTHRSSADELSVADLAMRMGVE